MPEGSGASKDSGTGRAAGAGYTGCGIMITREADYAVRCILYMSNEPGKMRSVREVAEAMHIPVSFLAKILQRLLKNGLVLSTRGAGGGFKLAREPRTITLLDVVTAIDGPVGLNKCAIEGQSCELMSTCPVHPIWVSLSKEIVTKLGKQDFQSIPKRRRARVKK